MVRRRQALGRRQAELPVPRWQFDNLPAEIMFRIGCFAGPTATVRLALSSQTLYSPSPVDGRGLTDDYIRACTCPDPCIGWDPWTDQVVPIDMPVIDAENFFLLMREETPEYLIERMLYFAVRARKHRLTLEIIGRLCPSTHLLGHVFTMILSTPACFVESVLECLQTGDRHCCQILLDMGATLPEEVAVNVSAKDVDLDVDKNIILGKHWLYGQWVLDDLDFPVLDDLDLPRRILAWLEFGADPYRHVFEMPFGEAYNGPDEGIRQAEEEEDEGFGVPEARWIYYDDGGYLSNSRSQFYSSANSSTPPLGSWSLLPDSDYTGGSTFAVSRVDTASLTRALAVYERNLERAAEVVRQRWTTRGWRFSGASREEQLREVFESFGHW